MKWEQVLRLDRTYATPFRRGALDELVAQAAHPTATPDLLAAAVAWLTMAGRRDEAGKMNARLRATDPWRAAVEDLWGAYYAGADACGADWAGLQAEAASREPGERARFFLAAGKLATDGGALDAARRWLLAAARAGRAGFDTGAVAAAFGSLGEVLYLGGQPLAALDALGVDLGLLPPASIEADRLRVYRAHCYRRLGQLEAARSLYAEAKWSAETAGLDPAWAERGLAWLEAHDALTKPGGDVRQLAALCAGTGAPAAHALVAAGLVDAAGGDAAGRRAKLEAAHALFSAAGYRFEPALLRGALPAPLEYPVPTVEIDACDRWLTEMSLRPRDESLALVHKTLAGGEPAEAFRAWAAAFF